MSVRDDLNDCKMMFLSNLIVSIDMFIVAVLYSNLLDIILKIE